MCSKFAMKARLDTAPWTPHTVEVIPAWEDVMVHPKMDGTRILLKEGGVNSILEILK